MKLLIQEELFTQEQAAFILGIKTRTMEYLLGSGKLPFVRNNAGNGLLIAASSLGGFLSCLAPEKKAEANYVESQKQRLSSEFPEQIKTLKEIDKRFKERAKPKGFTLRKVANKKLGFVYYVRYRDNGRIIPSNWSTGTSDREAAEQFAAENRERLLAGYFEGRRMRGACPDLYKVLKNYYAEGSPYLAADANRGRILAGNSRKVYRNFITKQFAPYLKSKGVKSFGEIGAPFLARFQDRLLAGEKNRKGEIIKKGVSPQTVNQYMGCISTVFKHLMLRAAVKSNPCAGLAPIRVKAGDVKDTGCYEAGRLKGAWNKKWKSPLSKALTVLQTAANVRNCEIEKIQGKDICCRDGIWHLVIPPEKSKGGYGGREIPLHKKAWKIVADYAKTEGRAGPEDYIFRLPGCKRRGSRRYEEACAELGEYAGYTPGMLKAENITFYSQRHHWKTITSAGGLAEDAGESLMGHSGSCEKLFSAHKSSGNVARNYNHYDKRGGEKRREAAEKLFAVLDKYIF